MAFTALRHANIVKGEICKNSAPQLSCELSDDSDVDGAAIDNLDVLIPDDCKFVKVIWLDEEVVETTEMDI